MNFPVVVRAKSFFLQVREEHFIVTASSIVKKKIVLMKKNFALETAHLFISLWSLSGKNLLCLTKLDLCTAVDNFPVIALLRTEKFDHCSAVLSKRL